MQNNKNGGRVRLKDIQNMLAKDFNIHYQNINGVHYLLSPINLILVLGCFSILASCLKSCL
jgi:hypothetical protein